MKCSLLVLGLLTWLAACQNPGPTRSETLPPEMQGLDVPFLASPMSDVYTSGQASAAQLEQLHELGVTRVVNLRQPNEPGTGWEEERATAMGIDFVRIPVAGKQDLTRDTVEKFAQALAQSQGAPTLVCCGSSNRVGALFALKAYWLDGSSAEDALQLGRKAGLLSLEPSVKALLAEPRTP